MGLLGHWLAFLSGQREGTQGGSSNAPEDPGDCGAASRRAAALLLNFMVP